MMHLNHVLRLIIAYYLLACAFNVVSIVRMYFGLEPLIKGNPQASLVMLTLFLVLAGLGFKKWYLSFIALSVVGLYTLTIRGFIPHIQALLALELPTIYLADWVVWLAVCINGFGLLVILLCIIKSPLFERALKYIQVRIAQTLGERNEN